MRRTGTKFPLVSRSRLGPFPAAGAAGRTPSRWTGYVAAVVTVALILLLSYLGRAFLRIEGPIMLYLLGVVAMATRFGLGPSIVTALLGVVGFDYVIVPPAFAFEVTDVSELIMLVAMITVATLVSGLTERLRREQELARKLAVEGEKQRSEIDKERVRSALLSAVSHDLRTPLAMISSSAQMLGREHDAMETRVRAEVIGGIAEQAERLDGLLANLLAMTRVEAGALEPRTLPNSLPELVTSAIERSGIAKARRIETRIAPALPLVEVDARLLEQVFINLLENANRYSEPAGAIRAHVERRGGSVVTCLEDDGPGVPEDELELVFQKFTRGRNAPRSDGGVGLGLTICRAVVEAHGGTISLANRKPRGAVITVSLPASTMTLAAATEQLPPLP